MSQKRAKKEAGKKRSFESERLEEKKGFKRSLDLYTQVKKSSVERRDMGRKS